MASTKLRFMGWPGGDGQTATLASVGGTGTPAANYAMTAIGTRVYEITITQALVGKFELIAGTGGAIAVGVVVLVDEAATIDTTIATLEADEAAIAAAVLAGIQPSSNTFTGSVITPGQETITVYQRDDYSASDGRAFDFAIVDAAIDFTNATVIKGPAGGQRSLVSDRIEATLSLQNKLNGSCTLRIEFTSAQLNQPAGQYQFNALVLVNGRRVTKLDLIVNVETQNADAAS